MKKTTKIGRILNTAVKKAYKSWVEAYGNIARGPEGSELDMAVDEAVEYVLEKLPRNYESEYAVETLTDEIKTRLSKYGPAQVS